MGIDHALFLISQNIGYACLPTFIMSETILLARVQANAVISVG